MNSQVQIQLRVTEKKQPVAHHVMWCTERDGGSSLYFRMGEKRNAHKILVGKIIEKRPVKIWRNTRNDIKYDKNSNMLGYDAVQVGKKLQKT